MKLFPVGLLLAFLAAHPASSGDYAWPTDASTIITSSFGEYRTSHIHGGVDVKTWGHAGYKAQAIDSGSVVLVSVSPYGYGKMVHFRTRNDLIAVYAHLSKFAPALESLIRAEQKRRGKYEIEKTFEPGQLTFKKGEPIGYTGATGASTPHLHFELRDPEGRLINPLSLGYRIQDTQIPVLKSLSAAPLCFGSHVDGDFLPKVYYPRRTARGKYKIDRPIACWGNVGLALSSYDMADGCPNYFAVYRVRLFVDDSLVFTAEYARFPFNQIREIEMERDCWLIRRGFGFFQKLYKESGNDLSFYTPDATDAGVLRSEDENAVRWRLPAAVNLRKGDHAVRILAGDYAGNTAEITATLRMASIMETVTRVIFPGNGWTGGIPGKIRVPKMNLEKELYKNTLQYRIRFDAPVSEVPRISIRMNGLPHALVPLVPKSSREFIGQMPLDPSVEGEMITEVRFLPELGWEQSVTDTVRIFAVTPESGGTLVSPDGWCRVVFPPGSVFEPVWGWIKVEKDDPAVSGGLGKKYSVVPNSFPLKNGIRVFINVASMPFPQEKIAVFMRQYGRSVFLGNERKGSTVSGRAWNLNSVTAIADTVPPVLASVWPASGSRLSNPRPRVRICFFDRLSGVVEEERYSVLLDSTKLVMEYDPRTSSAFSVLDEPLSTGKHQLDVTIRDRAGNVAAARKSFFVVSR